jgi:ABC-type bacteriocin/lantibiotic exporter with double-glycine peptidase domain
MKKRPNRTTAATKTSARSLSDIQEEQDEFFKRRRQLITNMIRQIGDALKGCPSDAKATYRLASGSGPARELDLVAYRAQFSVALQENPLFTATLRDNIAYGRPEASPQEVLAAIEMAQLSEFVCLLPAGLDTMLGEKGAKLSEGQAQRIGIARAILRDAPILLLDEPTSALDARGEERFLAALRNWVAARPQQRMVLIATHRGRTAATADRTYRIVAGQLAAAPEPGSQAKAPAEV